MNDGVQYIRDFPGRGGARSKRDRRGGISTASNVTILETVCSVESLRAGRALRYLASDIREFPYCVVATDCALMVADVK